MENNLPQNNEQEIDLIEIAKRLWTKRKFVIKVTGAFMILGLLVALLSPVEYSASCVVVPQTGSKNASGGLSGLAAMAGINLGSMGEGEVLSPKIYPKVINNINLQKELMYTKFNFKEFNTPISLIDYYTNPKYAKTSVIGVIKKYTIGLPFTILAAIKGNGDEKEAAAGADKGLNSVATLTKNELKCMKIVKDLISLNLNDKDGYISISANMPEALAAAQLALKFKDLLQKYITEFKIEKAQAQLTYITERYTDAKTDYDAKQEEYAKFQDANRVFSSALAKIKEERVKNDFNLANSLYSELAKQKIQAELKVKEDTPILTVVDPVVVPREKSKPKKVMILLMFTFLGGFFGCGAVFGLDFFKKNVEIKYLNNW